MRERKKNETNCKGTKSGWGNKHKNSLCTVFITSNANKLNLLMGSSRDRGVARESRGESGRVGENRGESGRVGESQGESGRVRGRGRSGWGKRGGAMTRERGKERQRRGREFKGICGIRGDPVKD